MELGDRHLKVNRASIGVTQAGGLDMGVSAMSMFAQTTSSDLETSRVIQLLNMVTAEELMDDEDYEGKFHPSNSQQRTANNVRNLRGCTGRMPEVRPDCGVEGSAAIRGQQTVARRGKDLCQVRDRGRSDWCVEGAGGKEVCRPNGRDDLLCRGKLHE